MGILNDAISTAINYSPAGVVYHAVTGSHLGNDTTNAAVSFSDGLVSMATGEKLNTNLGKTEFEDTHNNDWPAAEELIDTAKDTAQTVSREWEEHAGITLIDTAYNFVTGSDGIPHKARTTIVDTATNVVDSVQGVGDDAVKAVKKYWPFAAAGLVGLVVLKAAAPAVVSNLMKKR